MLKGADAIVFTSGIGKNVDEVRAAICNGPSWAGVSLNEAMNRNASSPIRDSYSRRAVLVLRCLEDKQIARYIRALIVSADSDRG